MLQNWLSPIESEKIFSSKDSLSTNKLGNCITIYDSQFPNLSDTDVAIIGIGYQSDMVRKALYKLAYPFRHLKIADLGNARKDDISFLVPIIKELLDSQIFPIIIGQHEQLTLAQFQAHKVRQALVNIAIVDEQIRYSSTEEDDTGHYLNSILQTKEPNLFHLGIIGSQSHYISEETKKLFDHDHLENTGLGRVKSDIETIEPLIRDADMLSFSLSALKQAEAPGVISASPSGLFSEEACQICRYAGMSDKLSSFGVYGYSAIHDNEDQTANVIAQMLWYLIEGYANRKDEFPATNEGLTEYIVEIKELENQITFWKSNKSGRWWIQVPAKIERQHERHHLIPCSYNDYQMACQEEIPERLINAFKKFS